MSDLGDKLRALTGPLGIAHTEYATTALRNLAAEVDALEDERNTHRAARGAWRNIAIQREAERDAARRELDELRQVVVSIATITEGIADGIDDPEWDILRFAQHRGGLLDRIEDVLLDYRDGWALDQAERRAALDPAPPHQDAHTSRGAPNSTPGQNHATPVATTPQHAVQSNTTQEDA